MQLASRFTFDEASDFGAGVLILAEQYPSSTTPFDQKTIYMAAKKNLRLDVEYPGWLREMDISVKKAEVLNHR
jgi:hypothetical protein